MLCVQCILGLLRGVLGCGVGCWVVVVLCGSGVVATGPCVGLGLDSAGVSLAVSVLSIIRPSIAPAVSLM